MATKLTNAKCKPATRERTLKTLARYEVDQGPLAQAQMDAIDRLQPPGRMKVQKSLF